MKFEQYIESRVNSEVKGRIYKILFYFTFLICVLLLFLNIYISQNEKVVLVPLNIPGTVTIRGSNTDPEYIKSLIFYVNSLLLSYDYQNADRKFELAINLFSEEAREKYKKFLVNELENIKLGQIVSYTEPLDIYVDNGKSLAVFSVKRRLWSKGLEVEKGDPPKWFYLKYKIDRGAFKIIEFSICQSVRCEQELGIKK